MTDTQYEQIFQSRLRQAVDELRRDGWEVIERPAIKSLPEPLHGRQPDLIARRGEELIIGEVKSRHSANLDDLSRFASVVSAIPHARFELYWLGDAPESQLPITNVLAFIQETSQLINVGALTAATLTAWAALEGALIHFASDKSDLQPWRSPRQLLSSLYSLGYISETDFQRLSTIGKARSDIAHHASRVTPSVDDIEFVLKLARRMVSDQYVSVDEMVEWFLENFEIPAMHTPHDSREGGYQYLDNGPYDPREVLSEQFPDATADDVTQAVDSLEGIAPEWVAKYSNDESPQDNDEG